MFNVTSLENKQRLQSLFVQKRIWKILGKNKYITSN